MAASHCEVLAHDRAKRTITLFDKDAEAVFTILPLGDELFDALEAYERGDLGNYRPERE